MIVSQGNLDTEAYQRLNSCLGTLKFKQLIIEMSGEHFGRLDGGFDENSSFFLKIRPRFHSRARFY